LERGADPHIEDMTERDACDYAELNNIHVFPHLNNCRQNSLHLRRRFNAASRQTLDQAKELTLKQNPPITLTTLRRPSDEGPDKNTEAPSDLQVVMKDKAQTNGPGLLTGTLDEMLRQD